MNPPDRCQGVLVGLAAGDRIGGPIRMALHMAESLIQRGRFDAADVLTRYVRWWTDGAFDTGPVADRALQLIAGGASIAEATARVHHETGGRTAGCNPAHRSSPLATCAAIPDAELADCARMEAAHTHADPIAGHVAGACTVLCRSLIRGRDWHDSVRNLSELVELEFDGPGSNGGFAPDVLRAAVHFVGTSTSFTDALKRSIAFAGPANYCPVLVGAIGGARWGRSAIPAAELAHVDILPRVVTAAHALATNWKADA